MASMNKEMVKKLYVSIGKCMKPLVNASPEVLAEYKKQPEIYSVGGVLDVETTDISVDHIEITELALRRFVYNKQTNEFVAPLDCYNELNEPSDMTLLTKEVQEVTGITPEKLYGKKIDFKEVESLINSCDFLIAHNAEFDKDKVLRYLPDLKVKWLCSLKMIDWKKLDVAVQTLECLALFFGFDYEAHRAGNDTDATLELLNVSGTFKEIVDQRESAYYKCVITGYIDEYGKTEVKDFIKNADSFGYKFDFAKNPNPNWYSAYIKKEDVESVKTAILNKVQECNPKGASKVKLEFVEN
jgi:DNA polymerase III epsilon subunit-like protein